MANHTAARLLYLHLLLPIISVTDSCSNALLSNSQPSACHVVLRGDASLAEPTCSLAHYL